MSHGKSAYSCTSGGVLENKRRSAARWSAVKCLHHMRLEEVTAVTLRRSSAVRAAKPVPSTRSATMSFSLSLVGGSVKGSSMSLRMQSLTNVVERAMPLGRRMVTGLTLERAFLLRGHMYRSLDFLATSSAELLPSSVGVKMTGIIAFSFRGSLVIGQRTTPSGFATRACASGVLLTTQKLVSAACRPLSITRVRPMLATVVTADEPLAARARKSA
mmetsp:Transcript_53463/g.106355  ORF Transcript_53463/g.106355 Transcript_53463/m.106355 type:complete len:216 (-) Transcript_53463:560-1207(-)